MLFKTTLARSQAVAKIFKVMNQNFPEQNHAHFSLLPAPARLDIYPNELLRLIIY